MTMDGTGPSTMVSTATTTTMAVKTIEVTFRYRPPTRRVASDTDLHRRTGAVPAAHPPKFRDVGELTRGAFDASLVRLTTTGRRRLRLGKGSSRVVARGFERVAFAIVATTLVVFALPACDEAPGLGAPDT